MYSQYIVIQVFSRVIEVLPKQYERTSSPERVVFIYIHQKNPNEEQL